MLNFMARFLSLRIYLTKNIMTVWAGERASVPLPLSLLSPPKPCATLGPNSRFLPGILLAR